MQEKLECELNPIKFYYIDKLECFGGKQTTRKVHTKLHPGVEWRTFHILTSEDIGDVISRSYMPCCLSKNTLVHIIKRNYTVA